MRTLLTYGSCRTGVRQEKLAILGFTTRYRLFLSLTECLNLIGGTYDAGTELYPLR